MKMKTILLLSAPVITAFAFCSVAPVLFAGLIMGANSLLWFGAVAAAGMTDPIPDWGWGAAAAFSLIGLAFYRGAAEAAGVAFFVFLVEYGLVVYLVYVLSE